MDSDGVAAPSIQARETLCPREMEGSSYILEDEGSALGDAEVDVDLTDASGENASSRASSAAMSRPMTRGTIETRPQSSGSIAIDDGASEHGWGGPPGCPHRFKVDFEILNEMAEVTAELDNLPFACVKYLPKVLKPGFPNR